MARPGIRYEDVEQAAETLARAHINPTHERIRHALGGGSFSTIGRHLQSWRQSCAEDEAQAQEIVPPDSLVDAVKGVWQGMRGAAEARVTEAQAAAQAVVEQTQSAAKAQLEALAHAHAEAMRVCEAQRESQRQKAQADAAMAQQRATDAATHHAQQREALGELEVAHRQSLAEAAEAQGRAQSLAEQCAGLKAQLQAAHAAHSTAIAQLEATHRSQAQQTTNTHLQALAHLADERSANQAAQAEAMVLLQGQMAQSQAETAHWQGAFARAESEREALRGQLDLMEAAKKHHHLRLESAERQAAEDRDRVKAYETALNTLRGENQGRVHLIQELREAFGVLAKEQLEQHSGDKKGRA